MPNGRIFRTQFKNLKPEFEFSQKPHTKTNKCANFLIRFNYSPLPNEYKVWNNGLSQLSVSFS